MTSTIKRAEETRAADCAIKPTRIIVIGKEFAPTAIVDIVYDQHDIKAPQYEFTGEVTVTYNSIWSVDCAERHIMEYAQKRGANAVIIGNSHIVGSDNSSDGFFLTGRLIRYK
ncbi:MAG: hypothetical protein JNN25_07975 [Candidatus Kapabacteria bacterium]|nr:hypothetical protein [Candidatus Kapabacteria bacterium]